MTVLHMESFRDLHSLSDRCPNVLAIEDTRLGKSLLAVIFAVTGNAQTSADRRFARRGFFRSLLFPASVNHQCGRTASVPNVSNYWPLDRRAVGLVRPELVPYGRKR